MMDPGYDPDGSGASVTIPQALSCVDTILQEPRSSAALAALFPAITRNGQPTLSYDQTLRAVGEAFAVLANRLRSAYEM